MKESFYVWREKVDTPEGMRLLVPHRDPYRYEYAFDYLFISAEAAYYGLYTFGAVDMYWESEGGETLPPKDWHPDGWVLCLETVEEL